MMLIHMLTVVALYLSFIPPQAEQLLRDRKSGSGLLTFSKSSDQIIWRLRMNDFESSHPCDSQVGERSRLLGRKGRQDRKTVTYDVRMVGFRHVA